MLEEMDIVADPILQYKNSILKIGLIHKLNDDFSVRIIKEDSIGRIRPFNEIGRKMIKIRRDMISDDDILDLIIRLEAKHFYYLTKEAKKRKLL